jgi:hypothetical protein
VGSGKWEEFGFSCYKLQSFDKVVVSGTSIKTMQTPVISTDTSKLDLQLVYNYPAKESYWVVGWSREAILKSIENAVSFSVYLNDEQIGFARVVTDYSTFAWLADVFVPEPYRGKGY